MGIPTKVANYEECLKDYITSKMEKMGIQYPTSRNWHIVRRLFATKSSSTFASKLLLPFSGVRVNNDAGSCKIIPASPCFSSCCKTCNMKVPDKWTTRNFYIVRGATFYPMIYSYRYYFACVWFNSHLYRTGNGE